MIRTQTYSSNSNQRLILPVWQDVRNDPEGIYKVGDEWQIKLRGTILGTAILRATVRFRFEKLTESCAHAVTGKGLAYHRKILLSCYHGLNANSPMVFNTWEWVNRDMTGLSEMLRDYWMGQLKLAEIAGQEPVLD